MRIMICLDDNGGMLFHNRRQSRDRKVVERILEIAGDTKLWIGPFSQKLFAGSEVEIDEELFEKAEAQDFCFVENTDFLEYIDEVDKIYIFRWNRDYPEDCSLRYDFTEAFQLISTEDFSGSSHERITLEVWER